MGNADNIKDVIKNLIVTQKLTQIEATSLFGCIINEVYESPATKALCPYCKHEISCEYPLLSLTKKITCDQCKKYSLFTSGTVRTKRYSGFSGSHRECGAHIRFIDDSNRERYVHLRFFTQNPELKSRDRFSLCIGIDDYQDGQDQPSNVFSDGCASLVNATIGKNFSGSINKTSLIVK
jgi:hypothetical protein